MTQLLASVRNLPEAEIALSVGVDIVDLKEPANGALGAVDLPVLKQVAQRAAGRRPISATIGDLPMNPELIRSAVCERFNEGADYVKMGVFPGGDIAGTLLAIKSEAGRGHGLVAVFFADLEPDLSLLSGFSAAGFAGVMLDTAAKQSGTLLDHASEPMLSDFVQEAHRLGMVCGLAGSLRRDDIFRLLSLGPDYLGFRGALCREGRSSAIDAGLVRQISETIKDAERIPAER